MDMATSHMHPKVIEYLNDNDIQYIIIPSGFTRYLQPLDIYVNKEFKLHLKDKYINQKINNNLLIKNDEFSMKKELIFHWVNEICKNEKIISKDVIYNVFKKVGISNNIDGSEDDLFNYPRELFNINGKNNENFKNANESNCTDIIIDDIEDKDLCDKEGNLDNSYNEEDPYYGSELESDGK